MIIWAALIYWTGADWLNSGGDYISHIPIHSEHLCSPERTNCVIVETHQGWSINDVPETYIFWAKSTFLLRIRMRNGIRFDKGTYVSPHWVAENILEINYEDGDVFEIGLPTADHGVSLEKANRNAKIWLALPPD